MAKITPEEFILRAIKVLPYRHRRHPEDYYHLGIRQNVVREAFDHYFEKCESFETTLDGLIRGEKIVAAKLVWVRKDGSSRVKEVQRLHSFPDTNVDETNPILYLADVVPKRIKVRLDRVNENLRKILG